MPTGLSRMVSRSAPTQEQWYARKERHYTKILNQYMGSGKGYSRYTREQLIEMLRDLDCPEIVLEWITQLRRFMAWNIENKNRVG